MDPQTPQPIGGEPDTDQDALQRARQRVAKLRGFYIHATVFILVNLFLLAVNLLTTPHFLWFFFPLLGWGIGLVIHGLTMFSSVGVFGRDWEERKVREYLEQERRR